MCRIWALARGGLVLTIVAGAFGCPAGQKPSPPATVVPNWQAERRKMVQEQIAARGVRHERLLAALERVPRHEFVPESQRSKAYGDHALPIDEGQTISQPYIVALMTELANPQPDHRVLEVGTGSGYQAAVLAELARDVYTIELLPNLAESAAARLERLGYGDRVRCRTGDGYLGWCDAAPFDSILVTCGADHVPEPLFEQLKPGGKLIIPIGPRTAQKLRVIEKRPNGERAAHDVLPVRFVPLRREDTLKQE